jgi:lysine-specific demethylase 3
MVNDVTLWRSGIVRATNTSDTRIIDPDNLQLLLEYSDLEWTDREWANLKEQTVCFYVEDKLVWGRRPPETGHCESKDIRWPTVLYRSLYDERHATGSAKPGVFMGDSHRMLFSSRDVKEFKDAEFESCFLKMAAFSGPLLEWRRAEKTREMLISGKYDLRGQRVRVYRTEVTQWFTASVVDQDSDTRTLTVVEDTILQSRHLHPAQVEVHLLELDGLVPEVGVPLTVSAFRPVARKRHHTYQPSSEGLHSPLTEAESSDLMMWKRRLRQHTPQIPTPSVIAPMSTRMVADYAKNGLTWEGISRVPFPVSPPSGGSVASPFSSHLDAYSSGSNNSIPVSAPLGNNRPITDKQHKEGCIPFAAYFSNRLNTPSTTSHLNYSFDRTTSTTGSIQSPPQHQHRSSASKSQSKASNPTTIASSSKQLVTIVSEGSEARGPEETDVASVLASMAALTSICDSNVTMQAGSSEHGDRNAMQHSVETILRNDDTNTVSLGNFFETVGCYRSETQTHDILSSSAVITQDPESIGLQSITAPVQSLHQTDSQLGRPVTPLRKQFLHHSGASVIAPEVDAITAMPRKKSSPQLAKEAITPVQQQSSPPRQPEQRNSPDQHALSVQQGVADQPSPFLTSVASYSTPQLPSMLTSTSTSSPPRLVADPSRCSPLPSLTRATATMRSPPPRHIEISPGLETGDEPLQPPAKRKKTAQLSGNVAKPNPVVTTPSQTIPPLIMADPEAARITTSITANVSPSTPTNSEALRPTTSSSVDMTDIEQRSIDHAPVSMVTSVSGLAKASSPDSKPFAHNPSEDNVMRFHRRLVKFRRASKDCQRLLEATATAETEQGRYVWFGSPQGMRILIDSTDRLARNLNRLKGYLQEALEAVCSSQKAMTSGVILPPLPPVTDIPALPPVVLSSQAQSAIPLLGSNSPTSACSQASSTAVSSSDLWVSPNVTQGRNVLGELSVGIDTLAMLIRTPRLRSAEKDIPSSSSGTLETPKRYVLSTKGMLESVTPTRPKKKTFSQKSSSTTTITTCSSDVDKLIQWPKHVTGASDDDRQRRSSIGLNNDTVRRRLTSDLGPNWKLDKTSGKKRATSESAQAKIKLANEIDQCNEDFDVEVFNKDAESRRPRNEDMHRSNSAGSLASDTTIIDELTSTKEQTGNVYYETAKTEQKNPPTDIGKEKDDVSIENVVSEKAVRPNVTVISISESSANHDNNADHDDPATKQASGTGAAVTKITKKSSQETTKQNSKQVGNEKPQTSRKRPRESGNTKKDEQKGEESQKPEGKAKKSKRPVGRPPLFRKKDAKKNNKDEPTVKKPETKPDEKPKKKQKVKGNDAGSVPAKSMAAKSVSAKSVPVKSVSGLAVETEQEKTPEPVTDGTRPRFPRVAKNKDSSGLQTGTCTQQRLLQSCMDCVKALRRGTGLRGERWCRFIHFRKLKRDEEGRWLCDGFADPFSVTNEDLEPYLFDGANDLDKDTARYIISCILPTFCDLVAEEESVLKRRGKKSAIAWKRTFVGTRELCDICATTIFNVHWFCEYCGFVVCIDCHRLRNRRENGLFHKCHLRPRVENGKDEILKVAQTFPKTVLFDLSSQIHEIGSRLNIKTIRICRCEKEQQSGETSSSGPKCSKKGKRHSKNSHTEKAEKNIVSDSQNADSIVTDPSAYQAFPKLPVDVPHHWLCDGRLLLLKEPQHPNNLKAFHFCWRVGKPVVVAKVNTMLSPDLWTPQSFGEQFGKQHCDMVNCRSGYIIEDLPVGQFWDGFEDISARMTDDQGEPMLLKLKDWPHADDFSELMPNRFEDLMKNVPLPEYTRRNGRLNLAARLPDRIVKPDLGPKMYNAYGSAAYPHEGTTNLHLDMSDAVNIMVYVGIPHSEPTTDEYGRCQEEVAAAAAAIEECDSLTQERLKDSSLRVGALWHIFAAEDAPKIRQLLMKVSLEKGLECEGDNDPIHDQCFYLDHELRTRLYEEYGVRGWAIAQCLGDAVFIPAGAPHQVRNLHSCIKIAEDFVSPEHLAHCVTLTHEFRRLSDTHVNHEDKLQIKNIIYHSVKDCLGVLISER